VQPADLGNSDKVAQGVARDNPCSGEDGSLKLDNAPQMTLIEDGDVVPSRKATAAITTSSAPIPQRECATEALSGT